ncbi:hypothetical protein AB0J83_12950 [Actinoplanes sp. NPDC049596]|uniref:hypothetical protein n=1 Tax=unclassified Actinoplanes TaxID=2626549 RepID=UPI00343D2BCD
MFPRTRVIPLIIVGPALLAACGEPPQPQPTSPTYATASVAPIPLDPSLALPATPPVTTPPVTVPPLPTTYPTVAPTTAITATTLPPTTTAPTEKSPTPTPSHAPKCTTAPTGPEIVALAKQQQGMAGKPLKVQEGPRCSGVWSFTALELSGVEEDPFMVVATGSGATLKLVAAGTEVCIDPVQNSAPPGIRVLACGF